MKQELDLREDEAFEHIVPLAAGSVEVLRAVRPFSSSAGPIFPGGRDIEAPLSENALGYLYNREGWKRRHVPHGWRSSFSTIMNSRLERLSPGSAVLLVDRLVIDLMLAHTPSGMSASELRYNRSAYLERRRELAEDWAALILEGAEAIGSLVHGPRRKVKR
jgi:integrase